MRRGDLGLTALILEAAVHLDPQQQGEQWPDPIAWDGRPLLEQASDMLPLLDGQGDEADDIASRIRDELPTLHDRDTGEAIRPATAAELAASIEAAQTDGGAGIISVGGRRCYVME